MICAVFDIQTGELVNTIVASLDDTPPAGCYLAEYPPDTLWDGKQFVSTKPIQNED